MINIQNIRRTPKHNTKNSPKGIQLPMGKGRHNYQKNKKRKANMCEKKCYTYLSIAEIQIKTVVRFSFILGTRATVKFSKNEKKKKMKIRKLLQDSWNVSWYHWVDCLFACLLIIFVIIFDHQVIYYYCHFLIGLREEPLLILCVGNMPIPHIYYLSVCLQVCSEFFPTTKFQIWLKTVV